MMPTVRPSLRPISFTSCARLRWSSAVPWEKFSRTTSTPARIIFSRTSGSDEAGPRVATIFVLRSMDTSLVVQNSLYQKEMTGSPGGLPDGNCETQVRLLHAALRFFLQWDGLEPGGEPQ